MPYKDQDKQKEAQHNCYCRNRESYQRYNEKARKEVRELIQKAKEVPCADCGKTFPFYVMDFDHIKGRKICNIGDMIKKTRNLTRIQEEIAKCEVVCSNCHRERTFQELVLSGKTPGCDPGDDPFD